MENKSKITYRRVGDYFIPNLILSPEERNVTLGKWGILHKAYLEKNKKVFFSLLLGQGKLYQHCAEVEKQAQDMFDALVEQMKESAIFINVGRGPIVVEQDLVDALNGGQIAAAGLDVLAVEPMSPENPLREIKDSNKLIITPHIAWASIEARTRLMKTISEQIKEFFKM